MMTNITKQAGAVFSSGQAYAGQVTGFARYGTPRRTHLCAAILAAIFAAPVASHADDSMTITSITYDAGDHITSVTDPRGLVTTYTYDGLGLLWQQISPDTGTTSAGFDIYGRRTSQTRADGTQTIFGYDAINRVISVAAGGAVQGLAYDSCPNGLDRFCSVSDATGTVSYSYTPEGWLSGRGFSIGGVTYALGFGYDTTGHLASVVYPDGNIATYALNRGVVSGVTLTVGGSASPGASSVTYRPGNGEMSSWTSSNGIANTLARDSDGRLISIDAGSVQALSFSYDNTDRLVQITNGVDGAMTQVFTYDAMSRLASVASGADNEIFQYDTNGNRLAQIRNGSTETVGVNVGNNQVSDVSGASNESYGYDMQGNLTTISGTSMFTYDAFNRMTAANGSSYYVNPEGQRLRKIVDGLTTLFAPSIDGGLLAESQSGGWSDYVWLNGRLVGRIASGQIQAIHDDQVGRPEAVTDALQAVVWHANNFAFDRTVTTSSSVALNIGFPGQYFDTETGLWNNGFRDYSPSLGRYVESDPTGIANDVNTYNYTSDNPIANIDPMGLYDTCAASVREAAACGLVSPGSAKAPQTDAFVFGSLQVGVPAISPVHPEGEAVALGGYSSDSGFYYGGILAGGGYVGGQSNNFGAYTGVEKLSSGEKNPIKLYEINFGPEVPFILGLSLGLGVYNVCDRWGLYGHVSGGFLGGHLAGGVGGSVH